METSANEEWFFASDEPIKRSEDDYLGWGEFAGLIANAVGNPLSSASMDYAIDGSLGSGKSSLLNLIEEKIRERNSARRKGERKTLIIRFTPWNCLDHDRIIMSFFDTYENNLSLYKRKVALTGFW